MKLITVPSSGSIANLVYSRNRGGQYTRNRTHPAQPAGTGRRATVKSNLTTASQTWSSLSDDLKAAWDVAARAHPVTNTLGQQIVLTGQQFYIGIACQNFNVFNSFSGLVPTDFRVFSAYGSILDVSSGTNVIVTPHGAAGGSDSVLVALSAQVSTGRRAWFVWWQATVIFGPLGTPQDITGTYTSQFGGLVSGKRIFAKFTPVNRFGVTGVPFVVHSDIP